MDAMDKVEFFGKCIDVRCKVLSFAHGKRAKSNGFGRHEFGFFNECCTFLFGTFRALEQIRNGFTNKDVFGLVYNLGNAETVLFFLFRI